MIILRCLKISEIIIYRYSICHNYFVISFNFEIVLFNFVGISGNVEDRFTRALEVFILPLS